MRKVAGVVAGDAAIFCAEPDRPIRRADDGENLVAGQGIHRGKVDKVRAVEQRNAAFGGYPEISIGAVRFMIRGMPSRTQELRWLLPRPPAA